jgi:hypothetical protein
VVQRDRAGISITYNGENAKRRKEERRNNPRVNIKICELKCKLKDECAAYQEALKYKISRKQCG